MYSSKVIDHFNNPRNGGEMADADVVGEAGSFKCGDTMKIFLKIEQERIVDVKFQTFGCAAAIASSSMLTEMVKGKKIGQARRITNEQVAEELGGLPPLKMHCSNLAADALQDALDKYSDGPARKQGRAK
ncbi:MAG: iron-sulfur cluster assembly scaffold protein [Firmicutes bacterium]|nr:iron-sulfur cluster assembly scaffold protein [Bacillota bacterium]